MTGILTGIAIVLLGAALEWLPLLFRQDAWASSPGQASSARRALGMMFLEWIGGAIVAIPGGMLISLLYGWIWRRWQADRDLGVWHAVGLSAAICAIVGTLAPMPVVGWDMALGAWLPASLIVGAVAGWLWFRPEQRQGAAEAALETRQAEG